MRAIDIYNNIDTWSWDINPHYGLTMEEAEPVIRALKKAIPKFAFLQDIEIYETNGFPKVEKGYLCPECKTIIKKEPNSNTGFCPCCGQRIDFKE